MFRLTHICLAVVLLCVLWTATESRNIDAKSLLKKLVAEKNKKAELLKEKEQQEKKNVKEAIAMLKKKTAEKRAHQFDLKSRKGLAVGAAAEVTGADKQLAGILSDAQELGVTTLGAANKKTVKKSYYEVFNNLQFTLTTLENFAMSPCSTGLMALADVAQNENVSVADMTSEEQDMVGLTIMEWWGENKCTEFFNLVDAFNMYLWSIFWDDLDETNCYYELPKDEDGTINWKLLYGYRKSPAEAASNDTQVPSPECVLATALADLYFDHFFTTYHAALPDEILEDIFNDLEVNDQLDPHFGLYYYGIKE